MDRVTSGEEAATAPAGLARITEEKMGPKNGSTEGLIGLGACQLCRESEFLSTRGAGEVFDM